MNTVSPGVSFSMQHLLQCYLPKTKCLLEKVQVAMPLQTLSITRGTNFVSSDQLFARSADLVCLLEVSMTKCTESADYLIPSCFFCFSLPLSDVHIVLHLSAPISIVNAVKLTWNCEDLPKAEELPELSREANKSIGRQNSGKSFSIQKNS